MKMKLLNAVILPSFAICILLQSCCISAKEEYLGNNLYLSEFDVRDRIIIYQEGSCAGSGITIIPRTVTKIGYNSNWIVATSKRNTDISYWIIKNYYPTIPDAITIKSNTYGPLSLPEFNKLKLKESIDLALDDIE